MQPRQSIWVLFFFLLVAMVQKWTTKKTLTRIFHINLRSPKSRVESVQERTKKAQQKPLLTSRTISQRPRLLTEKEQCGPPDLHKAVHSHSSSNSTLTYCNHYSEAQTDALKLHHLSDLSYFCNGFIKDIGVKGTNLNLSQLGHPDCCKESICNWFHGVQRAPCHRFL
jgi:hypothetical protein